MRLRRFRLSNRLAGSLLASSVAAALQSGSVGSSCRVTGWASRAAVCGERQESDGGFSERSGIFMTCAAVSIPLNGEGLWAGLDSGVTPDSRLLT